MRKVVTIVMLLCDGFGFAGWRKGRNNLKKVKRLFRKAQNMKRSGSKNPDSLSTPIYQKMPDFLIHAGFWLILTKNSMG
jgi:hypothetical protein